MSSTIDRRTVLAVTAASIPVAAIATVPALASPDAELIRLGRQLEKAVVAEFEATCDWAPRLCEAHRKVSERFGSRLPKDISQREAADRVICGGRRPTISTKPSIG
jgi:vacuolar-type H+-ATPase catalytic subunit A/Vma1